MNPRPLTAFDLDRIAARGCAEPNCKHEHDDVLFFNQKCCQGAGVEASYEKGTSVVTISCYKCEQEILKLRIAESDGPVVKQ